MRPTVVTLAVVAGLLPLFAPGCSRTPDDPLAALILELEKAAEAKDHDAFGERLASDFRGGALLSRADTVQMLRRYFAAYDTVSIDVYGVETQRSEAEAHVRLLAEFRGRARKLPGLEGFLPPEAVYRFELEARDESGTWRLSSARWEPTEPAGEQPEPAGEQPEPY